MSNFIYRLYGKNKEIIFGGCLLITSLLFLDFFEILACYSYRNYTILEIHHFLMLLTNILFNNHYLNNFKYYLNKNLICKRFTSMLMRSVLTAYMKRNDYTLCKFIKHVPVFHVLLKYIS